MRCKGQISWPATCTKDKSQGWLSVSFLCCCFPHNCWYVRPHWQDTTCGFRDLCGGQPIDVYHVLFRQVGSQERGLADQRKHTPPAITGGGMARCACCPAKVASQDAKEILPLRFLVNGFVELWSICLDVHARWDCCSAVFICRYRMRDKSGLMTWPGQG